MKVIEYEKKIVEGIYNNLELDGVLKLDYSDYCAILMTFTSFLELQLSSYILATNFISAP